MSVPLTARCSNSTLRRLSMVLTLPREAGAEAARPDASFSSAGFGSGSAAAAGTTAGAGRGTGSGGGAGPGAAAGDGLATDGFLSGVGGAEVAAPGLGPPCSSERRRSLPSCCLAERPRAVRWNHSIATVQGKAQTCEQTCLQRLLAWGSSSVCGIPFCLAVIAVNPPSTVLRRKTWAG